MDWFRFYGTTLHDGKIQQLPPTLFKNWVNTLAAVCLFGDGARVPPLDEYCFKLRLSIPRARRALERLATAQLLDKTEDNWFEVHNWQKWQYQSDSSTERVRKFREQGRKRQGNVSVTPSDTDTDTEQNRTPPPTPPSGDVDAPPFGPGTFPEVNPPNGPKWGATEKRAYFNKQFWPVAWLKRGKGAAETAFLKRASSRAVADNLRAKAVEQGPKIMAAADNEQHTPLHVSTWLNGNRDEDDWTPIERLDLLARQMRDI